MRKNQMRSRERADFQEDVNTLGCVTVVVSAPERRMRVRTRSSGKRKKKPTDCPQSKVVRCYRKVSAGVASDATLREVLTGRGSETSRLGNRSPDGRPHPHDSWVRLLLGG